MWQKSYFSCKSGSLDLFKRGLEHVKYDNFNFKRRKVFVRTKGGKKLNIKTFSLRRDRGLNFINLYLNLVTKDGLKETFLKFWNLSIKDFTEKYEDEENLFFSNYPKYYYYYYFKKEEKIFNVFINIVNDCLYDLEILFTMQYRKLNKQQRMKMKTKYKLVLNMVNPKKRYKHVVNLLKYSISFSKKLKLNDRLFEVFALSLFDIKKSYIWKRKIHIYTLVMEEYKKKSN